MSLYEDLVMQTQMNYSKYYGTYMSGQAPYKMSEKKIPYEEQIELFVQKVQEADCIIVGGASGLSAAGGGDFYYEDNESYRKYFKPFAEKYHFKGAFDGMQYPFGTREEHWGYLATFLHTTQTAPVRKPYLDLDAILEGKDFHILTTNQDTQFMKLYPEEKVSEIQGDHRFFQCSRECCDKVWDAVKPGEKLYEELLVKTEELDKTKNSMIFIERDTALSAEEIDKRLALLKDACTSDDDLKAKKALRKAVPTFKTPEEVNRTAFEKNEKENEEKQKKGLKVALF